MSTDDPDLHALAERADEALIEFCDAWKAQTGHYPEKWFWPISALIAKAKSANEVTDEAVAARDAEEAARWAALLDDAEGDLDADRPDEPGNDDE